jgi:hypothetical protein
MKFLMAMVVYLILAVFVGVGILYTLKGNPWLLIMTVLAYVLTLAKLGCLPKQSH